MVRRVYVTLDSQRYQWKSRRGACVRRVRIGEAKRRNVVEECGVS